MITLLDDYAIHQTAEPLCRPATSDRNFYDRWFFAGHAADGRLVFEAALGLYPHRQVMDAHFTLLVDGAVHQQTQGIVRPLGQAHDRSQKKGVQ